MNIGLSKSLPIRGFLSSCRLQVLDPLRLSSQRPPRDTALDALGASSVTVFTILQPGLASRCEHVRRAPLDQDLVASGGLGGSLRVRTIHEIPETIELAQSCQEPPPGGPQGSRQEQGRDDHEPAPQQHPHPPGHLAHPRPGP